MINSALLETIIGVATLYLLLSLLCSTAAELVAGFLKLRARELERGIRSLLNDPDGSGVAAALVQHPLVQSMTPPNVAGRVPSYLPARTFGAALFDVLAPADPATGSRTMEAIRGKIEELPNPRLKTILRSVLSEAGDDIEKGRRAVESWFDDAMDRVSGWYKRKAQVVLLAIALPLIVGLNADTLTMMTTIWQDTAVREVLVSNASQAASTSNPNDLRSNLKGLETLGWKARSASYSDPREVPRSWWGWPQKVLGFLITLGAVALGADFWFNALKKLINIRSAGKEPERTAVVAVAPGVAVNVGAPPAPGG